MKIAVIGRTYITPLAQQKYVALKNLAPEVELKLLVPARVVHVLGRYVASRAAGLVPEELIVCNSAFNAHASFQLVDPVSAGRALAGFQPDILHIEEDPYSVLGAEAIVLARLLSRKTRLSFFTWDNLARRPAFPKGAIKQALMEWGLRRAGLVVCGNREGQRLLHERKGYRGPSVVLPQVGLADTPALAEKKRAAAHASQPGDAVTIGFVGRLVEEKGLRVLRDAVARLGERPWRLVIIGSGPLQQEIAEVWQARFGSRFEWRPTVPHEDVAKALIDIDIFILPSLTTPAWKEQFGLTLAHAMMMGCACIGSDSGAIPEVIADAGLVTPEGNPERLVAAIVGLIDNPTRRFELGDAARRYALMHYTQAAVARGYLEAFRALHRS